MNMMTKNHYKALNDAVQRAVINKTCEQVFGDINRILDSLEPSTRKEMCVRMNSIEWE